MSKSVESFSFSGRIRSGKHAVEGVAELLKSQKNAWVHAVATCSVIAAGLFFGVSAWEWCSLVLVITLVWVAEALNTAFEFLCDVVSPDFHPLVKKSKDVAAGAVLISAMGAVAVGLTTFLPHLMTFLG